MLSIQHHSTFYQKWSRAFCQRTPPGKPPHPATLSAVQKKIKHDLFYSHVLNKVFILFVPFVSAANAKLPSLIPLHSFHTLF
jgi:hypothetical protein